MSNPSWGWGWSHPEGPPGPKRALKSCKQTNKRANLCCRRPAVLPGGLTLLFPAQRPASPGNLNFGAFSEKVKASSLHKTLWEIFMLGRWVKLLRVVKRRWTFSSLGRQGHPGVTHVPLWVRLLPAALLGGPASPPQGGFSLVGSVPPGLPVVQQPLVASQAAGTPQTGGEAASLRLQPRSRWGPLLPATTQQGLGHGGVCYHYPQRLGGPLSASSTAPCGQALPGLLCPSALRF